MVGLAQQRGGEQRVAQDGEGQRGDGGVHGGAVDAGAPEVQREHHGDQHDVEQRIGQRERRAGDAGALDVRHVRGVGESEAPGEREERSADQPGVESQADPAGPGDGALGEDEQSDDGGRREAEEEEVGQGGAGHLDPSHELVPAPYPVARRRHQGGEREQQPGRPEPVVRGAREQEAGDGGDQGGRAQAEVAHEHRESLRAPAHRRTHRVSRADEAEEEPGNHRGRPVHGRPTGQERPAGARRRAHRGAPDAAGRLRRRRT